MNKFTRLVLLGVGFAALPLLAWKLTVLDTPGDSGLGETVSVPIEEEQRTQKVDLYPSQRRAAQVLANEPTALAQKAALAVAPEKLDGRELELSAFANAEELLTTYWGPLWPQVKTELMEAGVDLEEYPFEQLRSWDAVRPEAIDYVLETIDSRRRELDSAMEGWSNLDEVLTSYGGPDANWQGDREQAWNIIDDYNRRILNAAQNFHSGLEHNLLDIIDDGERCPVHPIIFPSKSLGASELKLKDHAYLGSLAIEGWALNFELHRGEYPQLHSWMEELAQLRQLRKQYAQSLIGS